MAYDDLFSSLSLFLFLIIIVLKINGSQMFKQRTTLLFLAPIIAGALVGVFFLYPVNEFVYFHEHDPRPGTGWAYTWEQLWLGITGHYPIKVPFYAGVGAFLGLLAAFFFNSLYKSTVQIKQLSDELDKNLIALISHGESATTEFKSTFKWDLKESRPNKSLEEVVLKTLAGFMNGEGGSLIVGVADNGEILGLENDYNIQKKKDRDGFEQSVMASVSANLGTDACQYLKLIFHNIEGKDVCRIIASKSHRPIYIREGKDMLFYMRTGVSTRRLNIQEAVNYISTRWGN